MKMKTFFHCTSALFLIASIIFPQFDSILKTTLRKRRGGRVVSKSESGSS